MLFSFRNRPLQVIKKKDQLKGVIQQIGQENSDKIGGCGISDRIQNNKIGQLLLKESILSCGFAKQSVFNRISFPFTTSSPSHNPKTVSQRISTLFTESKQHQHILKLFTTFSHSSQSTINIAQNSLNSSSKQFSSLLLSPFKSLSQTVKTFIQQVQADQEAEISKWKTEDLALSESLDPITRQYRENFMIQIEERKLFYKRLVGFLDDVLKQMQIILDHQNINNQPKPTKKGTTTKLKTEQKSTLVQGDFFKYNFITQNYTQIYDQIDTEKQHYLMKSKKLKSFSILNLREYETNYGLKLRLLIKILGNIKQIYQIHLIKEYHAPIDKSTNTSHYPSLSEFLTQTIIAPQQYSQLLSQYFAQFSQQAIKNHLFMSIGYHSADTSELNKQLVDVKIRETNFKYDVRKMAEVYLIGQGEWLFNQVGKVKKQQNGEKEGEIEGEYLQEKEFEKLTEHKDTNAFDIHKRYVLDYAKVVLKQMRKNKQKLSQQHIFAQTQHHLSSSSQQSTPFLYSAKPHTLNHSFYSLMFNQLLPHTFFTISDVTQLLPVIQQEIMSLMVDPHQTYQKLLRQRKTALQKSSTDLRKNKHILMKYKRDLDELLREVGENMVFLSRFLEWDVQMIVQCKNFLKNLLKNEFGKLHDNIKWLKEVRETDLNPVFPHYQILKVTHLSKFLRTINIAYQILNKINPFYIEDYVNAIGQVESSIKEFVMNDVCSRVNPSLNPLQMIELLDRMFLPLMKDNQNMDNVWCAPQMRFRLLATFLDAKLINHQQFFTLLINSEFMQKENLDFISNPLLNYLYFSDGFEKTLYILALFREKQQYQQYASTCQEFQGFQNLIYSYQQKFNLVISRMENIDEGKVSKQQQKKHSEIMKSLEFYQENDILHRSSRTDDQLFVNWLDQTLKYHNKKTSHSQNGPQSQIPPLTFKPPRLTFQSPLNILLILSQNVDFLSSTIQMNYFNYIKSQIQQIYAFDKFVSVWNFPFSADIALQKRRVSTKNIERMYLKMHTVSGVRGRGRFFKEETVLRKDFMRFNRFSDFQGKDRTYEPITVNNILLGVRSLDKQIIQLKLPLDVNTYYITVVKKWLEGKFQVNSKNKKNIQQISEDDLQFQN